MVGSLSVDLSGMPDYSDWWNTQDCPFGCCLEDTCPECGAVQGGVGPVGCPCTELSPRPEQRPRPHVPIKRVKSRPGRRCR